MPHFPKFWKFCSFQTVVPSGPWYCHRGTSVFFGKGWGSGVGRGDLWNHYNPNRETVNLTFFCSGGLLQLRKCAVFCDSSFFTVWGHVGGYLHSSWHTSLLPQQPLVDLYRQPHPSSPLVVRQGFLSKGSSLHYPLLRQFCLDMQIEDFRHLGIYHK